MRAKIVLILKLSLVGLLLAFLAKKGLLSIEEMKKILTDPQALGIALAASVGNLVICIFRWQLLLRAQQISLSWIKTARLTLIGNFFNLALPGAVSGDVVKAFYIASEHKGRRGHVFGSILFDRVVGVSGLVLVATLAMLLGSGPLHDNPKFQPLKGFILLAFVAMLAFYFSLFFIKTSHDPILKILHAAQRRVAAIASLTRIYEGVRNYHAHRSMVAMALVLSCLVHFLAAFSCLQFFEVLDGHEASLWGIFVAVPLGLLVTAVPIAPAGVGTGHAAFSWLFLLLGSQAGANIFSLSVVFQLLFGALGGWVYLRYRTELPEHSSGLVQGRENSHSTALSSALSKTSD
ncbi:MAG: YbhN family protein [Oligoflexia bacterium]